MKKLFMMLALASISLSSMAQEEYPIKKYRVLTNTFWNNWFVQVGGNLNMWYSQQEHGFDLPENPLNKNRRTLGAAVAFGKWFTPGLGLRVKAQGIWGKIVGLSAPRYYMQKTDKNSYANSYWIMNGQALFNFSNMLCGYNPNRFWSFIPFVGAGVGRTICNGLKRRSFKRIPY